MSFQGLISAIPLTIGSAGSVGSAYLGGLTWVGHSAVGAVTPSAFQAFASATNVDGTYGALLTTGGNNGAGTLGTAVAVAIAGPGTQYRLSTPVAGVQWLRLDSLAGTEQQGARTILLYVRP